MEQIHPSIIAIWVAIFGACVGSFITMASYRLPLGLDIVFKPSHCPVCKTKLGFWDLFPIFSWLLAKGRCRHCGTRMSIRYVLIEIISALTFLGLYVKFGFTLECLVMMFMATCILILIVTDFEHYIIPDAIQVALFLCVIALLWIREASIENACYGLLAGLCTGLGLRYGYMAVRKIEALGWGDIKLLPIIGLAVGLKPFVLVLILSGLLGTLTGLMWRALGKGPEFPFGPALVSSMFVILVFVHELTVQPFLRDFFL